MKKSSIYGILSIVLIRSGTVSLRTIRFDLCNRARFVPPGMIDQQLCINAKQFVKQIFIIIICFFSDEKPPRESVQIASGYADNYNKYSFSLQDFQKQMQSLGEYLSAQIWIMDNQGNILFDSTDESVGKDAANANYKTLKGFNTSDFGNRYYN